MTILLALLKSYWLHCAVVLGAACIGFFAAWQLQGVRLDALDIEYAKYKLQVERQAVEARDAMLKRERQWLEDQEHARINAQTREAQLKKDATAARAATLSLRDDLAALRTRLATAPGAACINAAAAIGDLLGQCSEDYRALAETADRHVSDIRTLREAWPK